MLRRLAGLAIASVMLAGGLLPAAAPPPHPALARGLALMREGDFEAAVLELDAAVRKIESDPAAAAPSGRGRTSTSASRTSSWSRKAVARGKFREALARDPGLRLEPAEFSAQSIRVFEDVRAEAAAAVLRPRPFRRESHADRRLPRARRRDRKARWSRSSWAARRRRVRRWRSAAEAVTEAAARRHHDAAVPGNERTTTTTTTTTTTSTTTPGPPPTTQPPTTTPPAPTCRYDVSGQVNVPAHRLHRLHVLGVGDARQLRLERPDLGRGT